MWLIWPPRAFNPALGVTEESVWKASLLGRVIICIQQDQSLLGCFKICPVASVARAVNDNVKGCRRAVNLHRNGLRYECVRNQISPQFGIMWACICFCLHSHASECLCVSWYWICVFVAHMWVHLWENMATFLTTSPLSLFFVVVFLCSLDRLSVKLKTGNICVSPSPMIPCFSGIMWSSNLSSTVRGWEDNQKNRSQMSVTSK